MECSVGAIRRAILALKYVIDLADLDDREADQVVGLILTKFVGTRGSIRSPFRQSLAMLVPRTNVWRRGIESDVRSVRADPCSRCDLGELSVAALAVTGLFSHPLSKPEPDALVCPHCLAKPLVFSQ
jgi:hypothetical protein